MRISQAALASLFGQVVSHRGELLCAAQRSGETPRARLTFCAVYAWAALAFQLCNRIEASLDDRRDEGESDDDFSDDDDVEVRCLRRFFFEFKLVASMASLGSSRLSECPRRRRVPIAGGRLRSGRRSRSEGGHVDRRERPPEHDQGG